MPTLTVIAAIQPVSRRTAALVRPDAVLTFGEGAAHALPTVALVLVW